MKTATFYVLRIDGLYVDTTDDTLINPSDGTLAGARRFATVGGVLDWAQRRGKNHQSPTSLVNFEIVKVSETITSTVTETIL